MIIQFRIVILNHKNMSIGEINLSIEQIMSKINNIQEYPISMTDKVLQIMRVARDKSIVIPEQYKQQRRIKQTCSTKQLPVKKIQCSQFILERQKFLETYRRATPKNSRRGEDIENVLQLVRNIKEQIRSSRSKSNQLLKESLAKRTSRSNSKLGKQSDLKKQKKLIMPQKNQKIVSSPNVRYKNAEQYGFESHLKYSEQYIPVEKKLPKFVNKYTR